MSRSDISHMYPNIYLLTSERAGDLLNQKLELSPLWISNFRNIIKLFIIMFLKILQKYSHDFLFYIMNHDEVIREAIMFMFLCSSEFGCCDGNY